MMIDGLEWHRCLRRALILARSVSSLPGSSVHVILQARVLEWGAIAFSDRRGGGYLINYVRPRYSRCGGLPAVASVASLFDVQNFKHHPRLQGSESAFTIPPATIPSSADSDLGELGLSLGFWLFLNNFSGNADVAGSWIIPWVTNMQRMPTSEAQLPPQQDRVFQWLCGNGGPLTLQSLCTGRSSTLHG